MPVPGWCSESYSYTLINKAAIQLMLSKNPLMRVKFTSINTFGRCLNHSVSHTDIICQVPVAVLMLKKDCSSPSAGDVTLCSLLWSMFTRWKATLLVPSPCAFVLKLGSMFASSGRDSRRRLKMAGEELKREGMKGQRTPSIRDTKQLTWNTLRRLQYLHLKTALQRIRLVYIISLNIGCTDLWGWLEILVFFVGETGYDFTKKAKKACLIVLLV